MIFTILGAKGASYTRYKPRCQDAIQKKMNRSNQYLHIKGEELILRIHNELLFDKKKFKWANNTNT